MGVNHFAQAVKLSSADPRLTQNLALAYELCQHLDQANVPWNRYFDLLNAGAEPPRPPGQPDYLERLAIEGLLRLATRHGEREQWAQALAFVQRAQRLRPCDPDILERLFHLFTHLRRLDEARRVLRQLSEVRPDDPQCDLYELELVEVRTLGDVDRLLANLEGLLQRHPGEARVEERARSFLGSVVLPVLNDLGDRFTDRLSDVVSQVRRLPNYQINWGAVSDEVRDLQRDFQKLRRLSHRCLALVRQQDHRRQIHDLINLVDRKIDTCRSILR